MPGDWPDSPPWFTAPFANAFLGAQTTPGQTFAPTLLGSYTDPLNYASSASQSQGNQDNEGFGNAVIEGHVSYDGPGFTTYMWYRTKLMGPLGGVTLAQIPQLTAPLDVIRTRVAYDPTPIPSYVQAWFTDWDNRPKLLRPLARIEKLVASGTLAAWVPPAGGLWPPDPGLGPNCTGCPVEAVILWLQQDQNRQWSVLVQRNPSLLGALPNPPYPGVGASTGIISGGANGQVYIQSQTPTTLGNGQQVTLLDNRPVGIITDTEPAYNPPTVQVASGGGIGSSPVLLANPTAPTPSSTQALTDATGSLVAPVASAQPATASPTPFTLSNVALALGAVAALVVIITFATKKG